VSQEVGASDSNIGSFASPWATILHGTTTMAGGDTLIIKDGTYAEAILNYVPTGSGSFAGASTVKALNPRQAILQPTSGSFVLQVTGSSKQYIIFDGVVFDGVNIDFNTVKLDGNVSIGFPDHIRLTNCEVMNSGDGSGLLITTDGSATNKGGFNEILNCAIHDNGHDQAVSTGTGNTANIYVQNADNLFEGNDIYNGWGVGITNNKQNSGFPDRNIYRKNTIHDNGLYGQKGTGLVLTSNADLQIYNNLIYNNSGTFAYGIDTDVNFTTTSKIEHNTIYGNAGTGINLGSNCSNNYVRNNIVYNNGAGISDSGTGDTVSNNLTTNPSFVNAAGADFHLQSTSAAIGYGMDVSADGITTDFDGVSRPTNGTWDAGAYEFVSPFVSPVSAPGRGKRFKHFH